MTTPQKVPSSNLRTAISRITSPVRVERSQDMAVRQESRSRFFYVAATLFTAATVAAFFLGMPARVYLLGAILAYGFGVMITTLEDVLELLKSYWAARSATEWEDYARSLHGRKSWLHDTVIRGTDQIFGPIGADRNLDTLNAPRHRGIDPDDGAEV